MNESAKEPQRVVAEYDYYDENKTYQFTAVRFEPKTFRVKRRGANGQPDQWGQGDSKLVLYNLPALTAHDPKSLVVVVEGEKDVDRLKALGILAVTNPFGAGKWRPSFSDWLTSRHVLVIADNDDAGELHGKQVVNQLLGKAKTLKYLQFVGYPPKSDVTTFLEMGGTKEELKEIIKKLPQVTEPLALPESSAKQVDAPPSSMPTAGSATDGQPPVAAIAQGGAIAAAACEERYAANLENPLSIQHIARLTRKFATQERLVLAQAILADVQLEMSR